MKLLHLFIILTLFATYILTCHVKSKRNHTVKKSKRSHTIKKSGLLCDSPGHHHGRSRKKCRFKFPKKKRIFGGKEAKIEDYKFMGCLIRINGGKVTFLGGAVVLSKHWAIGGSAYKDKPYNDAMIQNKELYIGDKSANWELCTRHLVNLVVNYGDQFFDLIYSTILFRVTDFFDIPYADRIGLPNPDEHQPHLMRVIMLGWDRNGRAGKDLKYVETQIIDQPTCIQAYGKTNIEARIIKDMMFCTLRNSTNACKEDAGGPVYYRMLGQLVGIIAKTGTPCVNYTRRVPDLHLRMESFYYWIVGTIHNHTNT